MWFLLFSFVAFFVVILFWISIYRFIHKPLAQMVNAFAQVEDGDLQIQIHHNYTDEFSFLYTRFNAMVQKLDNLIHQVYAMQILTQKAQLKQLQAQINPHFLYNSFFVLHRRIKNKDFPNAMAMSQQLGNYFRFVTKNSQEENPLFEEIEHARIYADIQQIRFANHIHVSFAEFPEKWRDTVVPRLILQPVLENAFE